MRIDASSILFCLFLIIFKMEGTTAESEILVTYLPNPYSYCKLPILANGIPMENYNCTKFSSRMQFLDACAFYESDVILFYEQNTGTIYKERNHSSVDQRTLTQLHSGPYSTFTRITLDWLSKSLYWTDPLFGWIGVISIMDDDIGMYRILIDENIQRPHGITLDPFKGILFWTDIGQTVKIEKSNMSGDNRMVVISSGLIRPYSIVADVREKLIFWIDDGRDTIESSQYDGTGRRHIIRINHADLFDIEVFKDLVYVSVRNKNLVYIMNKYDGVTQKTLSYTNHTPRAIMMYDLDAQPKTSIDHCRKLQCSHICVSRNDGALCMCKEGFLLNSDGKCFPEDANSFQRALIVSNETSFCIADIHAISVRGYNYTCYLNAIQITHFELDTAKRELIFANISGLYYTSVDRFSVNHLLTVTGRISGLGFDWIDDIIFWSEEDTGIISSVSRLGTNRRTILSALNSPRNLLVLPLESRLFWVSKTISVFKIESSKFDGRDKKNVVQISFSANPASISFDPRAKRLYFVNNSFITSCFMDGSDVVKHSIVSKNTDSIYVYKGYLILHYGILSSTMSEIKSFAIEKLALNEKYPTQIRSIGRITDLKVYDERLQPRQKGPCEDLNGGCEHICIANGLVNRTCRCNLGFHADTINGNTCSSTPVNNNFLLVSDWTHDMIYQLSLDTNDVQAIDINTIRDPTGVAYDHTRKRVVWGSTKDKAIFSVSVNGTDETCLFPTGDKFPQRFAIDFSTGNIYYTAILDNYLGGYIGVLSVNSLHKLLIRDLRNPRGIALYPSKGLMFWTDFGSNPHVGRAQMDGQESIQIINTGVTYPNGLAMDFSANRLYWTDSGTDKIQSCNLNGSDRREIFSDSGAQLIDIAFDNAGYLYYTAWNRQYVTKVMLFQQFQVVHLLEKPELGRLDALDIYTVDSQPRNLFCSYNNGNCSTFCLPNRHGRTCSCEDEVSILEDGKTCSNLLYGGTLATMRVNNHPHLFGDKMFVEKWNSWGTLATMRMYSDKNNGTVPTSTARPRDTIGRPTTTANIFFTSINKTVTGDNNQNLIYIGVGSSAGFLVILVVIVITILCIRKRTSSRQRQSMRNNTSDETELKSIAREATGFERTISSVSEIYDTIQVSEDDSDPTYLTAVI